ncbi:hypothetical protein FQZ97_1131410 [compost metagenome]
MIAQNAQQRAAVHRVVQHAADAAGRAVVTDKGIDAEQRNALVAHGHVAALATNLLAQYQLTGHAKTQLVEQIPGLRLAHLIAGAQGVAGQQRIAVQEQSLALVLTQVQALQVGQITGRFGAAQPRCRVVGQGRRCNQATKQPDCAN